MRYKMEHKGTKMKNRPLHIAAGFALASIPLLAQGARADSTLTIATVNNVQMIEMQKLAPVFDK